MSEHSPDIIGRQMAKSYIGEVNARKATIGEAANGASVALCIIASNLKFAAGEERAIELMDEAISMLIEHRESLRSDRRQ